jgi:hypothetical protein
LLFYANTPEMLVSVGVLEVGMHFFAFDMLNRERMAHAQTASI